VQCASLSPMFWDLSHEGAPPSYDPHDSWRAEEVTSTVATFELLIKLIIM
jgi:hypothetical protein